MPEIKVMATMNNATKTSIIVKPALLRFERLNSGDGVAIDMGIGMGIGIGMDVAVRLLVAVDWTEVDFMFRPQMLTVKGQKAQCPGCPL